MIWKLLHFIFLYILLGNLIPLFIVIISSPPLIRVSSRQLAVAESPIPGFLTLVSIVLGLGLGPYSIRFNFCKRRSSRETPWEVTVPLRNPKGSTSTSTFAAPTVPSFPFRLPSIPPSVPSKMPPLAAATSLPSNNASYTRVASWRMIKPYEATVFPLYHFDSVILF